MSNLASKTVVETEIEAVVIRKDGTKEELGTVSYWHRNPLRRLWAKLNLKARH